MLKKGSFEGDISTHKYIFDQLICWKYKYLDITGLWRESGSAQRADGSKVNMNVKLYQENKTMATN